MRFALTLSLLASVSMVAACSSGGSSVEELEDRYGRQGDVTEDWLVGRWAEVRDRDCERPREFQRDGDLMDGGERREWRLRGGRNAATLEIDRDEYRAERYGSTLVLVDDRDRTTEYERCEGDSGASGNSRSSDETGGSSANMSGSGGLNPGRSRSAGGDPQLASEIATGVQVLRQQLPMRNGPMTITNASSNGTTLTLTANMNMDVTAAQWAEFETGLQRRNCDGPSGEMVRRGATVTTNITDSTGETRSITTDSCS